MRMLAMGTKFRSGELKSVNVTAIYKPSMIC